MFKVICPLCQFMAEHEREIMALRAVAMHACHPAPKPLPSGQNLSVGGQKVQALADSGPFSEMMMNLAGRWADEKKYEDIADYALPLKPAIEAAGLVLVKMTKRPFGVVVSYAGMEYSIYVTAREYGWKRVA